MQEFSLNTHHFLSSHTQLDIFANGLGSLMGGEEEDSSDKKEEQESNAGMELRILGNSLTPFVFFESMSDIMSLYWSGKLDEKTSALQVKKLDLFLNPFFDLLL